MSRLVRIAAGQGFWGDWLEAPRRQVEGGPIDYLMLDYLAEVTMSILQKQMQRDPLAGYARDFITQMEGVLPAVLDARRARGRECGRRKPARLRRRAARDGARRRASREAARGRGHGRRSAAAHRRADRGGARDGAHGNGRATLSSVRDRVLSANAYVGRPPIIEALDRGANVVVTGRCTDTALILAPLMHEYRWPVDDWDRLASGIVAGHIVECGAQSTGGNCAYDWSTIPDLENIGFPIVEVAEDASFVVTKHPGTGGRVDVHGVTEQLVYEMGDPKQYFTPDVIADFTTIRIAADGKDRVRVFGVHGAPPTDMLKVSIAYRDGYKAVGTLVYAWPDALAKAKEADRIIRARLAKLGLEFDLIYTEYVGATATHGPLATIPADLPEVQLRIGVRGNDRKAIERFTREIAPLVLTGPPGVTGYAGGRPKDRRGGGVLARARRQARHRAQREHSHHMKIRLLDIAHARSGDKGDTANVGVIALRDEWYPILVRYVTRERVAEHFREGDQGDGRALRAAESLRAQLPPPRRLGWRRHRHAAHGRAGEGLFVGDAPHGVRCAGRRGARARASGASRVMRIRVERTEGVGAHHTRAP